MTDGEVVDSAAINFSEYFKSIKEDQNLRKVAKLLYIFLTKLHKVEKYTQSNSSDNCIHLNNVEILNTFDSELQLINAKPRIKNKFKELLIVLKKFKVQIILASYYKKRNDCKIFYGSAEVIASNSDIEEALKCLHQSIMT